MLKRECDILRDQCHSEVDAVVFFKQKTAYDMRISDWSSDVCSSDLLTAPIEQRKWVIRRVALVAKVSELIAPPGMGKSSLALLLAVATATGRGDLIGFEVVRKGRVVVWNNEDEIGRASGRERVVQYV